MIILFALAAYGGDNQAGVDIGFGVAPSGTHALTYGRLTSGALDLSLTYRHRWYRSTSLFPWAEAESGFEIGMKSHARLDGNVFHAYDAVSPTVQFPPYGYGRFDYGGRIRVAIVHLGPVTLGPTIGLTQALPTWKWDVDLSEADPAKWGVDPDSVHQSWYVSMWGDVYGPSFGTFVRAGPIAARVSADMLFGPIIGAMGPPGSFGYVNRSVQGATGNLNHTARYFRYQAHIYRPGVIEPFASLEWQHYRAKVSDGAPNVATPLKIGTFTALIGVGVHGKPHTEEAAAAVPLAKGGAPLLAAAKSGKVDRVQALLADGVDPNTVDPIEGTALSQAAYGGHIAVMEALVAAGADPEVAATENGQTPLMSAAMNGQTEAVQWLLARHVAIDRKDTNGGYSALLHACYNAYPLTVGALLDAGANPTLTSDVGYDCGKAADAGFGDPNTKLGVHVVLNVHGL